MAEKKGSLDDYIVGDELGRGTYAIVKKATHKQTGTKYAIKMVKKSSANVHLDREIAIMKKVKHPHIVPCHDIFEDNRYLYLVLEFITGGDLFHKIEEIEIFSEKDAALISKQILEAVGYLHKEGIVHRDIKIDNILCAEGKELHVYLADFGLSRFFKDGEQLETQVGSLCYTAPEIYDDMGYNKACDMWSVGVVTFILLTGGFPFYDKDSSVTIRKIQKVDYEWDESEDVSPQGKAFIAGLLTRDPEKRFTAEQALKHTWITHYENLSRLHRGGSYQKLIQREATTKKK
jgi:calcium/calmodulin-dependent protein kinase I